VYASARRDIEAAGRLFQRQESHWCGGGGEVVTDRAPTDPRVLDQLWPAAWHHVERYANNRVEADHAQLKRWLRPMRGIKTMTGLRILAAGQRSCRTCAVAITRWPPTNLPACDLLSTGDSPPGPAISRRFRSDRLTDASDAAGRVRQAAWVTARTTFPPRRVGDFFQYGLGHNCHAPVTLTGSATTHRPHTVRGELRPPLR
jgi:DDE domain